MRDAPKIVSLATALAALATPVAALPVSDAATDSDEAQLATENGGEFNVEPRGGLSGEVELMSFTVHQASDGTLFPQHGSHSSHSSHSSHVSHSSGGSHISHMSGGVPSPYLPAQDPYPTYAPPTYAPPTTTTTTTPVPGASSDIVRYACTQASNGLGVNQIVSGLQELYAVSASDAVSIATQAWASVRGQGTFCDGYLGN